MTQPQEGRAGLADTLGGLFFRAASEGLSLLPRRLTMGSALLLGRILYHLMHGRRRIALSNVKAALGDQLGDSAQRDLARRSFGHSVGIAMDLLTLPRVTRDPERYCQVSATSLATLEEASARGKGVIMVAGHFGLMESMGIRLGHLGHEVSFVAKPFANPSLDAAVNARRGATGNGFIHKGGAMAKLREHLAAGKRVAVVVDQHVGPHDRIFIPFFGMPTATTRSLGQLAVETGAPILPIHAFPLGGGRSRCEFGPLLEPSDTGDAEADAFSTVERTIALMEEATRRQPEAWLWVHKRWKVRPDDWHGPSPYYALTEFQEAERRAARKKRLAKIE